MAGKARSGQGPDGVPRRSFLKMAAGAVAGMRMARGAGGAAQKAPKPPPSRGPCGLTTSAATAARPS